MTKEDLLALMALQVCVHLSPIAPHPTFLPSCIPATQRAHHAHFLSHNSLTILSPLSSNFPGAAARRLRRNGRWWWRWLSDGGHVNAE